MPAAASRPRKKKVRLTATTASGTDADTLKLTCLPRGWPSHGYDHRQHARHVARDDAWSGERGVARAEVEPRPEHGRSAPATNGVTATPAVGFGNVYVGSWNGFVVAAKQTTGVVKLDLRHAVVERRRRPRRAGLGDAHRRRARARRRRQRRPPLPRREDGKLLWKTPLGDPAVDQIWASPHRRRQPGLRRDRVALRQPVHARPPGGPRPRHGRRSCGRTDVPDKVCTTDTADRLHDVDGDCRTAARCVEGRGAGVTATVATDPTGEFVYMNTRRVLHLPVDRRLGLDLQDRRRDRRRRLEDARPAARAVRRVRGDPVDRLPRLRRLRVRRQGLHAEGVLPRLRVPERPAAWSRRTTASSGTRELVVSGSKDGSLYARDPRPAPRSGRASCGRRR